MVINRPVNTEWPAEKRVRLGIRLDVDKLTWPAFLSKVPTLKTKHENFLDDFNDRLDWTESDSPAHLDGPTALLALVALALLTLEPFRLRLERSCPMLAGWVSVFHHLFLFVPVFPAFLFSKVRPIRSAALAPV